MRIMADQGIFKNMKAGQDKKFESILDDTTKPGQIATRIHMDAQRTERTSIFNVFDYTDYAVQSGQVTDLQGNDLLKFELRTMDDTFTVRNARTNETIIEVDEDGDFTKGKAWKQEYEIAKGVGDLHHYKDIGDRELYIEGVRFELSSKGGGEEINRIKIQAVIPDETGSWRSRQSTVDMIASNDADFAKLGGQLTQNDYRAAYLHHDYDPGEKHWANDEFSDDGNVTYTKYDESETSSDVIVEQAANGQLGLRGTRLNILRENDQEYYRNEVLLD